jgi:hypothetical protein
LYLGPFFCFRASFRNIICCALSQLPAHWAVCQIWDRVLSHATKRLQMQAFQLTADEVLSDTSADEAEAERPANDPPKAPKNVWEQAAMAESGDSEGWESSDESGDERLAYGDLGNDEVSWPIRDGPNHAQAAAVVGCVPLQLLCLITTPRKCILMRGRMAVPV